MHGSEQPQPALGGELRHRNAIWRQAHLTQAGTPRKRINVAVSISFRRSPIFYSPKWAYSAFAAANVESNVFLSQREGRVYIAKSQALRIARPYGFVCHP